MLYTCISEKYNAFIFVYKFFYKIKNIFEKSLFFLEKNPKIFKYYNA